MIRDASKQLNINYSTAKTILRVYKVKKRILRVNKEKKIKLFKVIQEKSNNQYQDNDELANFEEYSILLLTN